MQSFGKWNAEKSKNFQNRTMFRCPYLRSKFYFIAPILNNSLDFKMVVKFLCLDLEKIWNNFWYPWTLSSIKIKKKSFRGLPRGVRQPPENRVFQEVAWPPSADPQNFFFYFDTRYMSRNIRNCFKFFLSPNTKISQPF